VAGAQTIYIGVNPASETTPADENDSIEADYDDNWATVSVSVFDRILPDLTVRRDEDFTAPAQAVRGTTVSLQALIANVGYDGVRFLPCRADRWVGGSFRGSPRRRTSAEPGGGAVAVAGHYAGQAENWTHGDCYFSWLNPGQALAPDGGGVGG